MEVDTTEEMHLRLKYELILSPLTGYMHLGDSM